MKNSIVKSVAFSNMYNGVALTVSKIVFVAVVHFSHSNGSIRDEMKLSGYECDFHLY